MINLLEVYKIIWSKIITFNSINKLLREIYVFKCKFYKPHDFLNRDEKCNPIY